MPSFGQFTHYKDSVGAKHSVILKRKFKSPAVFRFAHFYKHADLNHAVFEHGADFSGAVFDQTLDVNHTRFERYVILEKARFLQNADLNYCTFGGATSFKEAQFFSIADFNHCRFNSSAHFEGATFSSKADFNNAYFAGNADFSHATFDSVANFEHASFGNSLLLNHLGKTVAAKTQFLFDNAILPDTIDVSDDSTIRFEMDLLTTKLDSTKVHYINLSGSSISMIRLDYIHFRLFFPPHSDKESIIGTYEALLKKFRDLNDTRSYEILEKEFTDRFHGQPTRT